MYMYVYTYHNTIRVLLEFVVEEEEEEEEIKRVSNILSSLVRVLFFMYLSVNSLAFIRIFCSCTS